jgi:Trypsin-like serine proteases, typically periplasmic, contain C-terminal PDZ domain
MKFGPRLVCAALAAFVSLCALPFAEAADNARKLSLTIDDSPVGESAAPTVTSYADVLEPAQRAVVSVTSSRYLRFRTITPFPWGPSSETSERRSSGIGSGVIVTPDGYILTNNHVIENADELTVTLADSREFTATVIGTDPKTDVAVIKIEADGLPAVPLADSDRLRVGDLVFAIGNPLGVGQTVTMGIVSATSRRVGILDEVRGYENFIQTDAAINQGNSGGALLDAKGRLVGINSAILSTNRGNIGIGFAIPINLARTILEGLVETGKIIRGDLGVKVDALTPDLAETLLVRRDQKGVVISVVTPGGPADKAGLKVYDVIASINGRPIHSPEDLRLLLAQLAPNREAEVSIFRDGQAMNIKVQLGELNESLGPDELLPGVHVSPLSVAQRRRLGLNPRLDGLLITEVTEDSPYLEKLLPHMYLLQINREPVSDVEKARKLLVPGRNLLMVYYRGVVRPITINVR